MRKFVTFRKRLHRLNISIICLVLAIVCMIIGLLSYRQNLITAYAKEQAILSADATGQDTTTAIHDLKMYSENHMHASVSFWLEEKYNRDVIAAHDAATTAQLGSINNELYATAQATCGERTDSVTKANCIINYIHAHEPAESQLAAKPEALPDKKDYAYNFSSTGWSWDLAGISFTLGAFGLLASIALALKHK